MTHPASFQPPMHFLCSPLRSGAVLCTRMLQNGLCKSVEVLWIKISWKGIELFTTMEAGYIGLGLEASIVVAVLRCASAEVPCPGKQGKPCEQKSSVVKFQMAPSSLWCVNIVI